MSFPRYPEYKDSGIELLGEVPRHWQVKRIRHIAQLNPSKTEIKQLDPEMLVSFLPMEAVGDDGSLDLERETTIAEVQSGYTYFREGDVTYAKITPCFENGKGAHMRGLLNGIGFGSTELVAVRPDYSQTTSDYLNWIFRSPVFRRLAEASMYGAGGQKRVPDDFTRDFALGFPHIEEQVLISRFLFSETAKLDELMAEQEKLIALLKEKRQAVISHAVTKGLNLAAPMKDSGVEWLGKVPAHWTVIPLGRVTLEKCDGPFGSGLKSEHYTESGVRVIRLQNIKQDSFDGSDEAFIDAEYYQRSLSGRDVVAGDVLIAGLGDERNTVGRACIAPEDIAPAMVKADCFRFRLLTERAVPAFVARQLSVSSGADAGSFATGTTRSRIPLTVMATRKISLPHVKEQQEIATWIEQEMIKLDALSTECEHAIEILKERRSALISAAVTGQIDVRSIVKDEQEQAA